MNGSLHPERPTIAAATENRLTAESGLYLAQTPNAIGASTTALRCAVAMLAVVALVLGHQVALADEAGVSVWLPGTMLVRLVDCGFPVRLTPGIRSSHHCAAQTRRRRLVDFSVG